jgi:creatinine amidohydrolase/Fe(II)-dependent formamide hydrolase-like protein
VIGDEFDTTVRKSHHGIKHYDGLYDQSRHFDSACTRYFHRKGWGVDQFSILRPLSELLIEKVLVERYPEVQRLQTSCHAAHTDGDRVRPCGHCEKCARVVGMLTALGVDPRECSYTDAQVKQAAENLKNRGASLEQKALEHLGYLLTQRGLLPSGKLGQVAAKPQPDVIRLRFDRKRSAMEDIPRDIRQPLYRVLMEHSDGAVQRIGRMWVDIDPLTDPAIHRPYAFESRAGGEQARVGSGTRARGFVLGELTWPEAQRRFKQTDLALLPVGAIEQHGPHLPLDTDAFDADYLCRAVAERCSHPKPLVLPLVPYGVSYHHDDFAGTISISPKTLSGLVHEIGLAAARHGITKLVIVNGHGGNSPALHFAAQLINRDAHIFTCVDTGETSDTDIDALADTPNDVHAGEIETSTSLAIRPELVNMDQACKFVPRSSSRYLDFSSKRSVDWYAHVAKISPSGVLGDPTVASSEKGRKMWELMIEHLLGLIEHIKSLTLDEIHQRRE